MARGNTATARHWCALGQCAEGIRRPLITADLEAQLGELLASELLGLRTLLCSLLNGLLLLGQDHLNVARAVHVWANSAVGTVSAPAALLSSVHLDVLHKQLLSVQILELSVGLCIPQQTKDDLC